MASLPDRQPVATHIHERPGRPTQKRSGKYQLWSRCTSYVCGKACAQNRRRISNHVCWRVIVLYICAILSHLTLSDDYAFCICLFRNICMHICMYVFACVWCCYCTSPRVHVSSVYSRSFSVCKNNSRSFHHSTRRFAPNITSIMNFFESLDAYSSTATCLSSWH